MAANADTLPTSTTDAERRVGGCAGQKARLMSRALAETRDGIVRARKGFDRTQRLEAGGTPDAESMGSRDLAVQVPEAGADRTAVDEALDLFSHAELLDS